MKYLQIYDHNGNLTKEFLVYLDGEDFNWAAMKPEAIWLGTIRIVSEPSEILVVPTPKPEPEEPERKEITLIVTEGQSTLSKLELLPEPEMGEAEVESQVPFITQEPTTEEQPESEVKREPEKRSYKRSRKKRASSPDSS